MIMVDIKYCSQKGSGDTNQDFILCKQLQDGSCVAILADGMGGLQYGEIAAATTAQSIYETLEPKLLSKQILQLLQNARLLVAKWEQLLLSYI